MSEAEAPAPAPETATPAPSSRGKTVLVVVIVCLVLAVVAIAALTTAGGRVDRLLDEVGTTLSPVERMPDAGGYGHDDPFDPTEPETGTGTTGVDPGGLTP